MPQAMPNHPDPQLAWALLLAAGVVVASLVPLGAARSQADFTLTDLEAPRAMFERLPAWGKRANWAHQNSFEAFTLFAPACLLTLVSGVHGTVSGGLALAPAAWGLHRSLCGQPGGTAEPLLGRGHGVHRRAVCGGPESRTGQLTQASARCERCPSTPVSQACQSKNIRVTTLPMSSATRQLASNVSLSWNA